MEFIDYDRSQLYIGDIDGTSVTVRKEAAWLIVPAVPGPV